MKVEFEIERKVRTLVVAKGKDLDEARQNLYHGYWEDHTDSEFFPNEIEILGESVIDNTMELKGSAQG